jgi:multidrug efflux pump
MSRIFIERPIATVLLAVAVLLSGLLGYRALPVADLPQVEFPTIQVVTQLPGASAQTMETLITSPLERQLGQIAGLTDMSSTSGYGTSTIILRFVLGRDIDAAGEDVQAAINAAGGSQPKNLPYPPVYSKVNPADPPIVTLALTSATSPLREVSDVANTLLGQRLSRVSGVGLVSVAGNQQPAVRVRIDPAHLAAYGLSLEDLHNVLGNANVDEAKGTIDGTLQGQSIGANDQLFAAGDYADLILAYHNGDALRVRDIGTAVEGVENQLTQATVNGVPAVLVDVRRQPGANVLQTVERIRTVLPSLYHDIPASVHVRILSDQIIVIRASVADVQFTLLVSTALVVLAIFVFLGSARATLIPSVALPLSLIGTFGVMALCGFSLDNLSLMAMTIGTGFVVDDAIVMIENIVRYI